MYIMRFVVFISLVLLMHACSTAPDKRAQVDQGPNQGPTAQQMFVAAEKAMADGEYKMAIEKFDALNAQYPYGEYAEQAQLDIIYAYYQNGDYALAGSAAQHYIHLYPRARHVEYAYYMVGVANFELQRGTILKYLPLDNSQRDTTSSMQAYNDFVNFTKAFPNSPYVADAKQRMIYLRNLFALKELRIANYYYEHRVYLAAANRASYLIKNFKQAPQAEEALVLLVKANQKLGLKKAARDALMVLKENYPETYRRLR
jgi:outer membrane protein assembly factor BamD